MWLMNDEAAFIGGDMFLRLKKTITNSLAPVSKVGGKKNQ